MRAWGRWLAFAGFGAFVVGVIVSADSGRLRWFMELLSWVPFADKVGHVFLIGTLAFLLNMALGGRHLRLGKWRVPPGGLAVALAMTAEEVSQRWIPGRTFDLGDLTANYVGVALAWWLWARVVAKPAADPSGEKEDGGGPRSDPG